MKNIKLENGSVIKGLTFEKSFNGKFNCFTGRYNDIFFGGNDEQGTFKIVNYKDFGWNQIVVYTIENEVAKAFHNTNNKNARKEKYTNATVFYNCGGDYRSVFCTNYTLTKTLNKLKKSSWITDIEVIYYDLSDIEATE